MGKVLNSMPIVKNDRLFESVVKKSPSPKLPSKFSWPMVTVQYDEQPHIENEKNGDPYHYGWRYIPTTTEEGEIEWERVGLTLYDLLHP